MVDLMRAKDLPNGHPGWEFFIGRTPSFAAQIDQRFSYSLYVPSQYRSETAAQMRLLVAVHGTGRNAERTRDLFRGFAERHGIAVLAPLFPGGIEDPNDLHNYKLIDYRGIRFDRLLLSMVDEAHERWGFDVEKLFLAGFSGGGQFAHRFAFLHPDRLRAVSVGAPGRVTLPDQEEWPYGLGNTVELFDIEPDFMMMRSVVWQVVVGAEDEASELLAAVATDPREQRAGSSRIERASTLAKQLTALGISTEFILVDGAGHELEAVQGAVLNFFEAQL